MVASSYCLLVFIDLWQTDVAKTVKLQHVVLSSYYDIIFFHLPPLSIIYICSLLFFK